MGTKEDPFLIQSAADFEHLKTGSFGGKYFRMMTSVDLNNLSFSISSFNGVLDGNHCSVRGINISSTENTGLFEILESDNVMSNLSLYDKISGTVCTGALAAITKGVVSGVINYATVFGAGNLGGIIGNSSDT